MKNKKIIVVLMLIFLNINIVTANILYDANLSFSGGITQTASVSVGGDNSNHLNLYGDIRSQLNDFTQGKILYHNYYASTNLDLTAAANGINEKYTTFTATVDGVFYGSGIIGWQRVGASSDFKYIIFYDAWNTTYAQGLTGKKTVDLTYDHGVFTSYTGSISICCSGWVTPTYTYSAIMMVGSGGFADRGETGSTTTGYQVTDLFRLQVNNISSDFAYVNLTRNLYNAQLQIKNDTSSMYDVTSVSDVIILSSINNGLKIHIRDISLNQWSNLTLITSTDTTASYNLIFNKSQYSLGESVGLTYNITNPDTSSSYYLRIYQNFDSYNHFVYPISNGFITLYIDKTLKSYLQAVVYKNGIEVYASELIPYGFVTDINQITGNFTIDKYNYNKEDIMNLNYNLSVNGRFYFTCTGAEIYIDSGTMKTAQYYLANNYVVPCFVKMQAEYNESWLDIATKEYLTTNATNQTYFDKDYYSLGDTILVYYSSTSANNLTLIDSVNKIKFVYTVADTGGLTKSHTYLLQGTDAIGNYVVYLNTTAGIVLEYDVTKVMDAIIKPTPTPTGAQIGNLLDLGDAIAVGLIGNLDANSDNIIKDEEIQAKGNKMFNLFLLMVLLIMVIGTYGKIDDVIHKKRKK